MTKFRTEPQRESHLNCRSDYLESKVSWTNDKEH